MRTLKAPAGHLSVTADGKQYPVVDGLIEDVEDDVADQIMAHDARFTVHNDGVELRDAGAVPADELSRKELFATLKGMGVAATATMTTDQLRSIYVAEEKKRQSQGGAPLTLDVAKPTDGPVGAGTKAPDEQKAGS